MELTLLKTGLYQDDDFKKLLEDIENCQPLYVNNGGKYGSRTINNVLTRFEIIGDHYSSKNYPVDTLNTYLGSEILLVGLNAELKSYVDGIRATYASQASVMSGFYELVDQIKTQRLTQPSLQCQRT